MQTCKSRTPANFQAKYQTLIKHAHNSYEVQQIVRAWPRSEVGRDKIFPAVSEQSRREQTSVGQAVQENGSGGHPFQPGHGTG